MSKTMLCTKLKATAIAIALASLPLGANAAGLGKITILSPIGQPLHAEVDISATREEMQTLVGRIAPYAAFNQAGIEYPGVINGIRASIEKRNDGLPYLLLKSNQAINEPFLHLLLEVSWAAGRLQREYTFLLDPPESLAKPAMQAAPVALPAVAPISSVTAPAAAQSTQSTTSTPAASTTSMQPSAAATAPAQKKPDVTYSDKASPPKATATHLVKQGDTLSRIAGGIASEGVNLDQMLVALFRSNPDAFMGGNMNRLKTGRILSLPAAEDVAAIDHQEARQTILAHSADFAAYRKKLAAATKAMAAPQDDAPTQAVSGKIEPKVQDKAPTQSGSTDKLEVSKSASAQDAARGKAQAEDLVAREKSLKEANERIADLDKNLADMQKLLELKSQSMAAAQKKAEAESAAQAKQATPGTPVVEDKEAAAPIAATPAPTPAETTADSGTKPVETAAKTTADSTAPKPAAAKPPPKNDAPTPSSFIDDNPELVFGGGGLVALLIGFLGFKQWRRRKEAAAGLNTDMTGPISQSEPSINSVFGGTGGQLVDTGSTAAISSLDTDFSLAAVGDADANEGVDPVAEADVYMAYGRNAQAEEILLDALKSEPTRHAIHLKLLEIYAARKSLKQFETIASDLHGQTGGHGEAWEQAAQMGRTLDPDNRLYDASEALPDLQEDYDPAATMVMTPQDFDKLTAAEPGPGPDTAMMPAAEPEAPPEDIPESLDFELDLGGDLATAEIEIIDLGAEPADTDTGAGLAATEDLALDFDLGSTPTGDDSLLMESVDGEETTRLDDNFNLDANVDADLDLNLEAKAGTETNIAPISISSEMSEMPEMSETSEISEADTGLEFDLGESDTPPVIDVVEPTPAANSIDLSAISLELDDFTAEPLRPLEDSTDAVLELPPLSAAAEDLATPLTASAPPATAPMEMADEIASEAPDNAPGSPEVDTKLELASAYEEMGDIDGARELLQEALNEGNAAQKAVARGKLAQFG